MKSPSTSCRAVLARVSAYLDGELPPPDCHAIEAHCRTCDACARSLGSLCRALAICRKTAHRELPPAYRSRARERILALLSEEMPRATAEHRATRAAATKQRPARRAARRSPTR